MVGLRSVILSIPSHACVPPAERAPSQPSPTLTDVTESFQEPTPYFEGNGIDEDIATEILNERLAGVFAEVQKLPGCSGVVVVRLNVTSPGGEVDTIDVLSCTLQTTDAGVDRYEVVDAVLEAIEAAFEGPGVFADAVKEMGQGQKPSGIALPFVFN